MGELMNDALIIMAIGMGLVFIVILLLWGMMELLVKLIKDKPEAEVEVPEIALITDETIQSGDHKRLAAVLAVSTALMQLASARQLQTSAQPSNQTNNWQSVLRAAQRSQRSQLFARK
jgi:Na+-transporting methylmalonyl-CoA/oxaloacetate decarboxylase gamma subunit